MPKMGMGNIELLIWKRSKQFWQDMRAAQAFQLRVRAHRRGPQGPRKSANHFCLSPTPFHLNSKATSCYPPIFWLKELWNDPWGYKIRTVQGCL